MYNSLLRVDDIVYVIKRIFSFDSVKSEDSLREVMHHFGGADTLIRDNRNSKYLLTQKVDDAIIIWETENEVEQTNDSNTVEE
jgi:hypothetical protein